MQGQGLLFQCHNPFWKITGNPAVEQNPLKGYWAPNMATPDYVAAFDIKQFLAYGFILCYASVSPDWFTMWNMVEAEDVQWLREGFLATVEDLLIEFFKGNVEVGESNFDHGDWGEDLTIGNDDDEEEFMFTWAPHCIHEDAIGIGLYCNLLKGEGQAGDETVIWLSMDALKDRRAIMDAIQNARKINGVSSEGRDPIKAWKAVLK
jgi:hypothetical protein